MSASPFFALPGARAPRLAHPLVALWRAIVGAWRQALARTRQEHIDDATLRDIGIHRSELESFRAECEGRAEATRLRVIAQCHAGPW